MQSSTARLTTARLDQKSKLKAPQSKSKLIVPKAIGPARRAQKLVRPSSSTPGKPRVPNITSDEASPVQQQEELPETDLPGESSIPLSVEDPSASTPAAIATIDVAGSDSHSIGAEGKQTSFDYHVESRSSSRFCHRRVTSTNCIATTHRGIQALGNPGNDA